MRQRLSSATRLTRAWPSKLKTASVTLEATGIGALVPDRPQSCLVDHDFVLVAVGRHLRWVVAHVRHLDRSGLAHPGLGCPVREGSLQPPHAADAGPRWKSARSIEELAERACYIIDRFGPFVVPERQLPCCGLPCIGDADVICTHACEPGHDLNPNIWPSLLPAVEPRLIIRSASGLGGSLCRLAGLPRGDKGSLCRAPSDIREDRNDRRED